MSEPILVPLSDMENGNPIVVGIQENPAMKRWDVVLQVGNFKSRHSAETAARHIVRMVEDELGSRPARPQRGN
jgi:hypothetical protein